jgi:hypothetical protein
MPDWLPGSITPKIKTLIQVTIIKRLDRFSTESFVLPCVVFEGTEIYEGFVRSLIFLRCVQQNFMDLIVYCVPCTQLYECITLDCLLKFKIHNT